MEVSQEDVGTAKAIYGTLPQDHVVLQRKFERVMDGEDVKAMFPVSHNEKFFQLEDVEDNKEDWKLKLDHWERILASRAQSVTRVDWDNPELLCRMSRDINSLLGV